MTEPGKAAYPQVVDNATHTAETTQSRAYKETHKASMEMDDKQSSAAIKRGRRGGSCKERRLQTVVRLSIKAPIGTTLRRPGFASWVSLPLAGFLPSPQHIHF